MGHFNVANLHTERLHLSIGTSRTGCSTLHVTNASLFGPPQSPSGRFGHTNAYERLTRRQFPNLSSDHRMHRLLTMTPPAGSVAGLLSLLSDTADPSYPIFRNNRPPDHY